MNIFELLFLVVLPITAGFFTARFMGSHFGAWWLLPGFLIGAGVVYALLYLLNRIIDRSALPEKSSDTEDKL